MSDGERKFHQGDRVQYLGGEPRCRGIWGELGTFKYYNSPDFVVIEVNGVTWSVREGDIVGTSPSSRTSISTEMAVAQTFNTGKEVFSEDELRLAREICAFVETELDRVDQLTGEKAADEYDQDQNRTYGDILKDEMPKVFQGVARIIRKSKE